jgi:hypothetical protein
MDVLPVVATLLGTAFGVASTLLVDRRKWDRERRQNQHDLRRGVYVRLLAALNLTQQELYALARRAVTDLEDRERAALASYGSNGLLAAHEELTITAPGVIREASEATVLALREIRNVIARGHLRIAPEYVGAYRQYQLSRDDLRAAMRNDLDF